VRPARTFINRILTLLRNMGQARRLAIDQGTKRDLRWFIACAHAVNGSIFIHKWLRTRVHFTADASLKNRVIGSTGLKLGTSPGGQLSSGRPLTFWLL
jgi:hypothetical protein